MPTMLKLICAQIWMCLNWWLQTLTILLLLFLLLFLAQRECMVYQLTNYFVLKMGFIVILGPLVKKSSRYASHWPVPISRRIVRLYICCSFSTLQLRVLVLILLIGSPVPRMDTCVTWIWIWILEMIHTVRTLL